MKMPERSRLPDNVEIPGLYPRRRRFPNWPVWLWLVVAFVAAIPAVGVPGVVLAHYTTSNASFCLTCHGTGDTPDRSVPSVVHPSFDQVSCVDCHAKPGQIVFEGYVKGFQAEPEWVSANCIRCHQSMPQKTDNSGFKFNARGIIINHSAHLARGATCVTCHSNIAHDLREPRTNRPRMDACLTCHSSSDSCTKCHGNNIPAAPQSRELVGRKPVLPPPAQPTSTPTSLPMVAATAVPTHAPAAIPGPAPTTIPTLVATEAPAATATKPPATLAPAVDTQAVNEGKALFVKTCTPCHGPSGDMIPAARLNSKSFLQGYGADALALTTAAGKGGMPAFGAAKGGPLDDQQIKAIVTYLFSAAN